MLPTPLLQQLLMRPISTIVSRALTTLAPVTSARKGADADAAEAQKAAFRSIAADKLAAASSQALPPHLQASLKGIAAGETAVLVDGDSFRFKCTNCGECCRRFGDSLFLSPFDMFLVSRAPLMPSLGVHSTTDLLKKFPTTFRIEPDSLLGTASIRLSARNSATSHSSRKCTFAQPIKTPSPRAATSSDNAALLCALGPQHMPAKCASYPIGRGVEELSGAFFLDDHCEGLLDAAKPPERALSEYAASNSLASRWAESDWFQTLKGRVSSLEASARASSAFGSSNPMLTTAVCDLLATVWFDFDAYHPSGAYPNWATARTAIADNTQRATAALSQFIDALSLTALPTDRERFRQFHKSTRHLMPAT